MVKDCKKPTAATDHYFLPVSATYKHGEKIKYSCNGGLTISNGATVDQTCEDGTFKPATSFTCNKGWTIFIINVWATASFKVHKS